MRIRNWLFAVAFLAAGLGSESARAELVTFRVTGILTGAVNTQSIGLDDAQRGDAFTIDYTFESSTPGIYPTVFLPQFNLFAQVADYSNAIVSMVWTVNGRSSTGPLPLVDPHIRITNDAGGAFDEYILCGFGCIYLLAEGGSFPPSAITSLALPLTPPNVNLFNGGRFAFYSPDGEASRSILFGNITSIELSPVPLPAAAPLLVFGLAGLAALARRRSRRAVV